MADKLAANTFPVSDIARIPLQVLDSVRDEVVSDPVIRVFLDAPEHEQLKIMSGLGALYGTSHAALKGEKLSRGALTGLLLGAMMGLLIPKILKL
ncbi:MAG: hypothetical protein KatS3mg087_0132 [Patescibacteria group bacterium]|nr:MAG: hypothetical protein KatS3mg087_0132 [Patescibacteria group bacterium]